MCKLKLLVCTQFKITVLGDGGVYDTSSTIRTSDLLRMSLQGKDSLDNPTLSKSLHRCVVRDTEGRILICASIEAYDPTIEVASLYLGESER